MDTNNTTTTRHTNLRPHSGGAGSGVGTEGKGRELFLALRHPTLLTVFDDVDYFAAISGDECEALLRRYGQHARTGSGICGQVKLIISAWVAPRKPEGHQIVIVLGRNDFDAMRRRYAPVSTANPPHRHMTLGKLRRALHRDGTANAPSAGSGKSNVLRLWVPSYLPAGTPPTPVLYRSDVSPVAPYDAN